MKLQLIVLFIFTSNLLLIKGLREEELMKLPKSNYTLLWVNTLTEFILNNEKYGREQACNCKGEDFSLRKDYILAQFRKLRRVGRAKNYFNRNDVYRNTLKKRGPSPQIKSDTENTVKTILI